MISIQKRKARPPFKTLLTMRSVTKRLARVQSSTLINYPVPRSLIWKAFELLTKSALIAISIKSKYTYFESLISKLSLTVRSQWVTSMKSNGMEDVPQVLRVPSAWTKPSSWTRLLRSSSKPLIFNSNRCTRTTVRFVQWWKRDRKVITNSILTRSQMVESMMMNQLPLKSLMPQAQMMHQIARSGTWSLMLSGSSMTKIIRVPWTESRLYLWHRQLFPKLATKRHLIKLYAMPSLTKSIKTAMAW